MCTNSSFCQGLNGVSMYKTIQTLGLISHLTINGFQKLDNVLKNPNSKNQSLIIL
jgi:hypothetical protein